MSLHPHIHRLARAVRRLESPKLRGEGFHRFQDLPRDPQKDWPLHQFGEIWKSFLGSYWTVPVSVPLSELQSLRAVVQYKPRLASIKEALASGIALAPIEIGVYANGSGYLIDGNHRLVEARRAKRPNIAAIFTFAGT